MYGTDMYITQYQNELGPPWKNQDLWIKISYPFFHADRIHTPTLFMGGDKDFNVPLVGGEQMYQALRSLGVDTQLVIYPNQFHGITMPSYKRSAPALRGVVRQVSEEERGDDDVTAETARQPARPRAALRVSSTFAPRASSAIVLRRRSAARPRPALGRCAFPCFGSRSAGLPSTAPSCSIGIVALFTLRIVSSCPSCHVLLTWACCASS